MYNGEKIVLRSFEMTDLNTIMKYWNNWELRRYLGPLLPTSRISEEEWLQKTCKHDPIKDMRIDFAMIDKGDGNLLGTTMIFNIDLQSRRGEFGIVIYDNANFNKGYGTDATLVTLWVAFHILNLRSVYLKTIEFNVRGIRAYEKSGFKFVSKFRNGAYLDGKYHDLVVMDVLKEEFLEIYPAGKYVNKK